MHHPLKISLLDPKPFVGVVYGLVVSYISRRNKRAVLQNFGECALVPVFWYRRSVFGTPVPLFGTVVLFFVPSFRFWRPREHSPTPPFENGCVGPFSLLCLLTVENRFGLSCLRFTPPPHRKLSVVFSACASPTDDRN